jgi:hypothetical protein
VYEDNNTVQATPQALADKKTDHDKAVVRKLCNEFKDTLPELSASDSKIVCNASRRR